MNKKKIAVLTIMVGVMSYATYQSGKSKINSKNERAVEVNMTSSAKSGEKFEYYSENEIRNELQKAGVSKKSIETFILANKTALSGDIPLKQKKDEFIKVVEEDKKNYLAVAALGKVAFAQNERSTAISYYKKSIEINPKFQKGYENLIRRYRDYEDYENLKITAEQLIKLYPENPVSYDGLYHYFKYKKDYKKAIEAGKKAIELYLKGEPKYYNYEFATTDLIHRIAKDLGQKPEETELTNDYEGRNFQLYILDAYIEQGNAKETFDYFFNNYQKLKDNIKYMGDMDYEYKEWIDEYIDSLKKINDKYKNKDKRFYEENLKKFKALK